MSLKLSLEDGEEAACETFKNLRWKMVVLRTPRTFAAYEIKTRRLFKCKGCFQFGVPGGTNFASRKMEFNGSNVRYQPQTHQIAHLTPDE